MRVLQLNAFCYDVYTGLILKVPCVATFLVGQQGGFPNHTNTNTLHVCVDLQPKACIYFIHIWISYDMCMYSFYFLFQMAIKFRSCGYSTWNAPLKKQQ